MRVVTPYPSVNSQAGSAPSGTPSVSCGTLQTTSAASSKTGHNVIINRRLREGEDCWAGNVQFLIQGGQLAPSKDAYRTCNLDQYFGNQRESGDKLLHRGVYCADTEDYDRQFTATLTKTNPDASTAPANVDHSLSEFKLRVETIFDPETIMSKDNYDPNNYEFECDDNGFQWRNGIVQVTSCSGTYRLEPLEKKNIGKDKTDTSYTAHVELVAI